jgi:K+-transporting ATPase ATPase C chain
MLAHLRANIVLLVLTVVICCVLYPLTLWAIGQTIFHDRAQGSIVLNEAGEAIGSRLIAQEFKGDEYFQPRPSAASYKADASGATNFGANNYLLRDSVARRLGPIVRYGDQAEKHGKKAGELVGPDIDKWFQQDRYQNKPGIVAQWAGLHGTVAEGAIKDLDGALKDQWKVGEKERPAGESFMLQFAADYPELHQEIVGGFKGATALSTADLAAAFFPLFSKLYPGEWLTAEEDKAHKEPARKKLARVKDGSDIQSVFFDMWRQDNADVSLEAVPADMVTTSASGLDPHITLKNARYQLKYRIPEARTEKILLSYVKGLHKGYDDFNEDQRKAVLAAARQTIETKIGKRLEDRLAEVIGELLTKHASAPLGGLVGVPLINVLEVNIAMDKRVKALLETGE